LKQARRRSNLRPGAGSAPASLAALPKPFFIAHRGMADLYPENTLEAYRGSVALGIDVVEIDCWLTGDGTLVCMHDSTLDRTTNGSGNTHDLRVATATALRVDAGSWFAPAWPSTLRVPTFMEVLDELGGLIVLCPEAKNAGAGQAIVDQLVRLDLLDTGVVQSFIRAELTRALTVGGAAMALIATSSYDVAELHNAGIRYLGLSTALPPSLVAPAIAAGLEVVVWVVERRVDSAPWRSAGAVGFVSDDPLYLSGRSPVSVSDPYSLRTYYHGHLASAVANDRGQFVPPRGWGYIDTSPEYKGALQGWACPISGATADYTITLTIGIVGAISPEGWAGIFICAADDRSFDDAAWPEPGLGGYHVLLRRSGSLEVHVVHRGTTRLGASVATAPIEPGGSATLRIDVTQTQVAVTRVDVTPSAVVTVIDTMYRGGYFHLGRRAAAVHFSDVTIT
jgi:glycerophosphoryl diester phosphodiesterase